MGSADSNFLDLVYGAAIEPELWTTVLERFADLTGGSGAWISRLNMIDGSGSVLTARIDPVMPRYYFEHFADRNPLSNVSDPKAYMSNWVPRILTDEDWMPKEDLIASDFYNGFMRPQDVHSALMVRLAANDYDVCVMNIARPQRRGQFDKSDIERAHALHPHLIRAFALGQRLNARGDLAEGAKTAFEATSHAVFLADERGHVRFSNALGETLIRTNPSLRLIRGRLVAASSAATGSLQALIAAAATKDPSARRAGSMVLPPASTTIPLAVTVAPVGQDQLPIFPAGRSVLICVTDLQAKVHLPERRLRDLFALTPAEARVALALFDGKSPKETATILGLSVHTVHVHIAHIFTKTDTNRQSELIKLMMRAVGPNFG